MRIEPRLRREIPTGLAQSCLHFTGRELKVRLAEGWGWHHYIDGVQQTFGSEHTYDSGELAVSVRSFFQSDDRLRGLTAIVRAPGHILHGLNVVLFTMSDGEHFDFSRNICMAWGASFGDQKPTVSSGGIPGFDSGIAYTGYATVFEDEADLRGCQERLNRIDPSKQRSG